MSTVITGRMTHRHEGELVVFHIGMQINRWWRPDLWLPTFFAMPPMLRELSIDPTRACSVTSCCSDPAVPTSCSTGRR